MHLFKGGLRPIGQGKTFDPERLETRFPDLQLPMCEFHLQSGIHGRHRTVHIQSVHRVSSDPIRNPHVFGTQDEYFGDLVENAEGKDDIQQCGGAVGQHLVQIEMDFRVESLGVDIYQVMS